MRKNMHTYIMQIKTIQSMWQECSSERRRRRRRRTKSPEGQEVRRGGGGTGEGKRVQKVSQPREGRRMEHNTRGFRVVVFMHGDNTKTLNGRYERGWDYILKRFYIKIQ